MGLTLLEKSIKGDKRAFKKLMIKNSEYIYKLAFMHTKYEYDSKEIMKNSIFYINENIHRLSKFNNFNKYITKVTIKQINEYMEEMGMVDNENINYLDESGYIDMYKAIDILDIYQKNVVILLYFYNMSYKEVGDILDMNESTVKMYLRNSLKIMRDKIKGEFIYGENNVK